MTKCPQCLGGLPDGVAVCAKCGFKVANLFKPKDQTLATELFYQNKMSPEKWNKIKGLFEAAKEIEPAKRGLFLKRACGSDSELQNEVSKLLASFDNAESFMETPPAVHVADEIMENETRALNQTTGDYSSGSFVAGTVIDKRYRIIGLIGKGGMGEVYRAEDLKLHQDVALKFLPGDLEKNRDALKRFVAEVRNARRVSHQNVCKVYDIGDIDGKHFISMEFIDGDDLSQLLKRIGRLPSDKAAEISRQICFGLHAIHDAGILHRDLKPANIIIDSNGKARITDFGIAGIEEEISGKEIRVGTPAYMSPEQITGKEVTSRSDVYSLGLLLYEIFTGKQAVEGDTFEELANKHSSTSPKNPSTLIKSIDPIVEKTINRCLEKLPRERPASALEVALSLPGGNPLEAAIAAGETPSPEMVAAAPKKGALRPLIALGLLIAFVALYFGIIFAEHTWQAYALIPLDKSPEVLAEKSQQILHKLGYTEPPTDIHYEFDEDDSFFVSQRSLVSRIKSELPPTKELLRAGQPYNTYFLYRQSPDYLEPVDSVQVRENEPALDKPNMANVKLDVRGRLLELLVVPPGNVQSKGNSEVEWQDLFLLAGLDVTKFKESVPTTTPPVFADERRAWTGTYAEFDKIPIRVESAAFNGRPVSFKIIAPWDIPVNKAAAGSSVSRKLGTVLIIVLIFIATAGSSILAYKNLRAGRGDLRGGLKLTVATFGAAFVSQLILADHVPTIWGELSIIYEAISKAIISSVLIAIMYVALEPFVRRSWSEMLISWNRIMTGDFRDPMVGRDVLVGGLLGLGHAAGISIGIFLVQAYTGNFDTVRGFYILGAINGTGNAVAGLMDQIVFAIIPSLVWLFIAYLFVHITGKKRIGIWAVGLLFLAIQILLFALNSHPLIIVSCIINTICMMIALGRHGLLGMIAFWLFFYIAYLFPVTFDTSSFYFPASVLTILVPLGVISYCYYISIAGQPIFGTAVSDRFND